MKIKMRTTARGPNFHGNAGQTLNTSEEQALDLIAGGYAEEVVEVADDPPRAEEPEEAGNLEELTVVQLTEIASALDIDVPARTKKDDLIELIEAKRLENKEAADADQDEDDGAGEEPEAG